MPDLSRECPFPPSKACNKVKELTKRIAELESQVVRMQCYDDNITQSRVFSIKFSELLDPQEAMDIFIRNIQEIFKGGTENVSITD